MTDRELHIFDNSRDWLKIRRMEYREKIEKDGFIFEPTVPVKFHNEYIYLGEYNKIFEGIFHKLQQEESRLPTFYELHNIYSHIIQDLFDIIIFDTLCLKFDWHSELKVTYNDLVNTYYTEKKILDDVFHEFASKLENNS